MMGFLQTAQLFSEAWKLYRKFFNTDMSEADFDHMVKIMEMLYEKYKKQPLAKDLLLAVGSEIERKEKCRRLTNDKENYCLTEEGR